jgi:ribosomal protein L40E
MAYIDYHFITTNASYRVRIMPFHELFLIPVAFFSFISHNYSPRLEPTEGQLATAITMQPEVTSKSSKTTMFCKECGAKIPRDSDFCEECGSKLVNE